MPAADPPLLLTRGDVASLVGLPLKKLTWWVWALNADKRYDSFEIPRRGSNQPRQIQAPIKPLKDIQRRLVAAFRDVYVPPSHVHGFVNGRGPRSSATVHVGQEWLLRVDIKDFFPSINFGRVRGLFMAHPFEYPEDVATVLAQICCHRNELPQGAPTSPLVSNLLCRRLDRELSELAVRERCYFTRYADDLTFSTDRTVFPESLATLTGGETSAGPRLLALIASNGFELNDGKSRLMRRTHRQRTTGLVVNQRVNVPREYVLSLRNLLYIWRKYGEDSAIESLQRHEQPAGRAPSRGDVDFKLQIRGRVQHVGSVKGWSSSVYQSLAAALMDVDDEFTPTSRAEPARVGVTRVEIFTEGESDLLHLLAAQRYFNSRGEFTSLNLISTENSALGSDAQLARHLKTLVRIPSSAPRMCLFDADQPGIIKQVVDDGQSWKVHAYGLSAVVLVPPPWRTEEPVCIELLHEGLTLRIPDADGRRLYERAEFDSTTGHHTSDSCTIPVAPNKTLIQESVHGYPSGRSVGLSKMRFAELVRDGAGSFADISFEGFRSTFLSINEAADASLKTSQT